MRTRVTGVTMAIAVALGVSSAPARAVDLTGTWRVEHFAGRVQDVPLVDQSGVVAGPLPGLAAFLGGTWTFDGTFDQGTMLLDGDLFYPPVSPTTPGGFLTATVFPDGNHFDGKLSANTGFGIETLRTAAHRCECDDDNTVAGDGCDARCRVETCFTCTGTPSVCTPSPDGAACDDRGLCTTGETCSAGVCGGGAPVSPCVDFTGLWFTTQDVSQATLGNTVVKAPTPHRRRRAHQYGTTVVFRDETTGEIDFFGTMDPVSGAFTLGGGRTWALRPGGAPPISFAACSASTALAGALAVATFAGTGTAADGCVTGPVSVSGVRLSSGCSNGTLEPGEECDDGNTFYLDGCDPNCRVSGCGNGADATNEGCDDGNLVSGDGCDANCTPTGCGNGILTAGEACDDGNLVSGDGCDANCTPTVCGNGAVAAPEQCDDGNTVSGDGCDANCTTTSCGNGIVTTGEPCDDGNAVSGDGCDANCTTTSCGNGIVTAGEPCDDGDTASGDGCDVACNVEPCFACDGQPSVCAPHLATECSRAVKPSKARFALTNLADAARDVVQLKLARNAGVPIAALGDPLATTAYDVCVVDRAGPTPTLRFAAHIPAGGVCDGRPCWRAKGTGFAYGDKGGSAGGITSLTLASGVVPRAGVLLEGRGANLSPATGGLPTFPVQTPLTVQVRRADGLGACFEAIFGSGGVKRNDARTGRFAASGTP